MDLKLHEAARKGNVWLLTDTLESRDPSDLTRDLTPQRNTVLHIAVRFEQEYAAEKIMERCPSLVSQPNSKGDTPLHLAARAGHLPLTKILTYWRPTASSLPPTGDHLAIDLEEEEKKQEDSDEVANDDQEEGGSEQGGGDRADVDGDIEAGPQDEIEGAEDLESAAKEAEVANDVAEMEGDLEKVEEEEVAVPEGGNPEEGSSNNIGTGMVLKMRNCKGNTAIHEALKNSHEEVALFLLSLDGELALDVNNAEESPIYLAAEAGLTEVVSKILDGPAPFSLAGPDGQTLLHIAVIRYRLVIVKMLSKLKPELVIQTDCFGKTALHYAVTMCTSSCLIRDIFLPLLSTNPSAAYVCDKDHHSPLQLATKLGRPLLVGSLLERCPDSAEIVDGTGRNVFHLAAMNGNCSMLKYLLKRPELKEMVNEADDDGNRPIHLAIMNNKFWVAWNLTGSKVVDCRLANNQGLTALDVLELNKKISYRQALIRHMLLWKGRPRGRFDWLRMMKPRIIEQPSVGTNKILAGILVLLFAIFLRTDLSYTVEKVKAKH